MEHRRFLHWLLALFSATILLCLPTGVNSSDELATKVAFSRRVGKVNTYVELRCTATKDKPRCDVPDAVKIIQTGSPTRISAEIVSIPDSLLVTAAKNNADTLAPFERPSFRVTMEDKQVFDIRLTSSITLLLYNHKDPISQEAKSAPALPEVYVRHAPKRSTFRPSVFVDATQKLLDIYQTTLQDAARGSDDVFNSGAFATYVFAPAFKSLRHTLHHLPIIYKKYGYQNERGELVKDITEDDVSLVERLAPTLCNGFVELQYWTSAIEEIFIKHSDSTQNRDKFLQHLFSDASPSDLPGHWKLPDDRNPCRQKKGDVHRGGRNSILALREGSNMLAPGEAAIAKAQTEAYMLGSDVSSIADMIMAPLSTNIDLNEKDQKEFDEFKKNVGKVGESSGGSGLISAFVEKQQHARRHLRHLLAENKGKWWNRGKQEVQNRLEHGKQYANDIKSDFSQGGIFSKDGVDIVKNKFFKKKPKNPFEKGDGSFTVSMSHEDYKKKNGLAGTKDRAYLNMKHMRNDNRKMQKLKHLERTGWRNSKEARDLRAQLINKRDPMDDVEFGIDNEVTADWGKGKASKIKLGAHVKKGAVKAGFFVQATAKLGNIIRREGAPEATATVTGFVQVDKKLRDGSTLKSGMFVSRTVAFKDGKLSKTKSVKGDFAYVNKEGWQVSQHIGFTSQGEGDLKVDVKTKFKDKNAFGIDGLCVMADIGFTCHKKATGEFEFSGNSKPKFKFSYNPSFQPKWIKDMRAMKKNWGKTAKTFKFNSKYSAEELESLHRENMISNKINKASKWSSVSFGGDMGVMMHDD